MNNYRPERNPHGLTKNKSLNNLYGNHNTLTILLLLSVHRTIGETYRELTMKLMFGAISISITLEKVRLRDDEHSTTEESLYSF